MRIMPPSHVDLTTASGPMRTHLFRPLGDAQAKFPGVVLYSEIYQMTSPIARTAATIAGKGFLVAVPEVYHEFEPAGTVLAYDKVGTDRGNDLKTTKRLEHYDDDARAVIDYLNTDVGCTGNVGAIGICLGGHLAFRAAMHPLIKACACLYATDIHKRSLAAGMHDNTLDRMPEIKGEMLMMWGRQDPHIPADGRRLIYDTMTAAGVHFTWHEFNGEHAFIRDEGHRFDPSLSQLVHILVDELFTRCLKR
jgi:carboxymethylenebutenolidase